MAEAQRSPEIRNRQNEGRESIREARPQRMRAEDMAQFRFSEGGRQYVLLVPPSQAREVRGDSPIRADLHRYLDSHPRARVYDVTGVRSAGESFTDRELTNREVNVRDILRG